MRLSILIAIILFSTVFAEKYALIFATADGWPNYGAPSVLPQLPILLHRKHAEFIPI